MWKARVRVRVKVKVKVIVRVKFRIRVTVMVKVRVISKFLVKEFLAKAHYINDILQWLVYRSFFYLFWSKNNGFTSNIFL